MEGARWDGYRVSGSAIRSRAEDLPTHLGHPSPAASCVPTSYNAGSCGLLGLDVDDVPTGCPTKPRSGGELACGRGCGWKRLDASGSTHLRNSPSPSDLRTVAGTLCVC